MEIQEEVSAVDAAASGHGVVVSDSGERFEKSELEYFVVEDRHAGQAIGKLLAVVFLISLVLMSGVCLWMFNNGSGGPDPQAGIGAEAEGEHH